MASLAPLGIGPWAVNPWLLGLSTSQWLTASSRHHMWWKNGESLVALEADHWELLFIFCSQSLHLLMKLLWDECVTQYIDPLLQRGWASQSEILQPCLMPRMVSVPLGIPYSEARGPSMLTPHLPNLCLWSASISYSVCDFVGLPEEPNIITHHQAQPKSQAARGGRQSLVYTLPLSHRGENPWPILRSQQSSMPIWLF